MRLIIEECQDQQLCLSNLFTRNFTEWMKFNTLQGNNPTNVENKRLRPWTKNSSQFLWLKSSLKIEENQDYQIIRTSGDFNCTNSIQDQVRNCFNLLLIQELTIFDCELCWNKSSLQSRRCVRLNEEIFQYWEIFLAFSDYQNCEAMNDFKDDQTEYLTKKFKIEILLLVVKSAFMEKL